MTSTAHEDQFTQAQDLENECKRARMKSSDVCKWEQDPNGHDWNATCGRSFLFFMSCDTPKTEEFKFCPFCGKKIEVEE
jgi:hypothetical protein